MSMDILLTVIIGVLLLMVTFLVVWLVHFVSKVQDADREYMRAIIAKNVADIAYSKRMESQPQEVIQDSAPDIRPLDTLSDSDFMKAVRRSLKPDEIIEE